MPSSTRPRLLPVVLALLILLALAVFANPVRAQEPLPVAHGIFFYSPACSHCHDVIDNHWAGIEAEFGDQLRVLFVDVSQPHGAALMQATQQALRIPSSGVPMLVLGERVLVGSVDIPQMTPAIVQAGLVNGGIAPPPVEGIDAVFEQVFGEAPVAGAGVGSADVISVATPSLTERFLADPIANTVAVALLVVLVGSLGAVALGVWRALGKDKPPPTQTSQSARQHVLAALTVVGLGLAFSLILGSLENVAVSLLAFTEVLVFAVFGASVFMRPRSSNRQAFPDGLLVLLALAGLGVAGYLAYVEVTLTEAVCGTVGNCNAVQQSAYARLFGIPIAVMGAVGYVAILGLVGLRHYLRWSQLDVLLLVLAVIGTAFSAYLTFLEPFVIGASCVWCLTSALVMLMMLWLVMPVGLGALQGARAQ